MVEGAQRQQFDSNSMKPAAFPGKVILPVFVTRMHDERHGDAFVLVAAPSTDAARFEVEKMVARDFPRFSGTQWTPPQAVDGLYFVRGRGVLFAAMPKQAPIIVANGN